jgi:outer membrane lipoprotein SlyB
MSEQVSDLSVELRPVGPATHVPRGVWISGTLLGMVTAGLAGALIMRTVGPGSAVVSVPPRPAALASFAPQGGQAPAQFFPNLVLPAAGVAPAALHRVAYPARALPLHEVTHSPVVRSVSHSRAASCPNCGTVESVVPVQSKGQGTGIGAVTGGVLGAVVGNQIGGGNGKKAMAVLGAIGGGFAGNEVEKRVRGNTVYNVRVRMDDGSIRSLQREQPAAVGTHVVLNGNTF